MLVSAILDLDIIFVLVVINLEFTLMLTHSSEDCVVGLICFGLP